MDETVARLWAEFKGFGGAARSSSRDPAVSIISSLAKGGAHNERIDVERSEHLLAFRKETTLTTIEEEAALQVALHNAFEAIIDLEGAPVEMPLPWGKLCDRLRDDTMSMSTDTELTSRGFSRDHLTYAEAVHEFENHVELGLDDLGSIIEKVRYWEEQEALHAGDDEAKE